MKSAIDKSGRVIIPKPLRDKLGLAGGEELEVTEDNGAIEIRPASTDVEIIETAEGVVAVPKEPALVLTADEVRATLDRVRR
ncbi:MAG: AbrB/MazE/SpoVT family DNA-binding domain-containing protein [Acidimicrobiales bacterium]